MSNLYKIMFRSSTGTVQSDTFKSLYSIQDAMRICSKHPHLHFTKTK